MYPAHSVTPEYECLRSIKMRGSDSLIFVNNQLDGQFFFMYVYFYSLHVSGSHVPIIRRISCINTTFGKSHCVYMTVWWAGLDETQSLRVSGSHVPIIRRINCIKTTFGISHSV
jgi:hypothetical protein